MRTLSLIFATLLSIGSCYAQNNTVRMPEPPSKQRNIAEWDKHSLWCAFEAGGGSTTMENHKNVAMTGASVIGGYRLNQYFKVGIGLGILYYPNSSNVRSYDTHFSMPLFANLRGNFLSDTTRRTVPFWSVNAGMSFPDGGFFTPAVGLRVGEKRNAFLISLAYTLRHLDSTSKDIKNYSGVFLKLGYEY